MKPALLVMALVAFTCMASAQTPASRRMVVVVSLDGFPAFALDDPKLPIPVLRSLMKNGVSARMTTVNPTVTWPNHTAMVTGVAASEHGLIANGTIVRTGAWPPVKVDPMLEKAKMVRVPTVYDAAHNAGLTTAQVDWVAIEKAASITWPFAEWAAPGGVVEQEMIQKGLVQAAELETFTKLNILRRDQIWTSAGVHLIAEHKPNLLLIHFLTLDSTHHQYGPGTLAATGAIAFLDSCVGHLVDAVRAAGMASSTTFFVVSDHGFKKYTKQVKPAVALVAAGLGDKAFVLPEGGSAYIYFEAAELMPRVRAALQGVEGIDRVNAAPEFAALGLPKADDPQMYQLLLTAKDGYSFSGATGGPVTSEVPQQQGSHGYLASDPEMDAIFIASGYGVSARGDLGRIANIDVASTLAKLLGVSLPESKGKPISISGR
jgi:predicted AlkP superfamily pyrophosphatase or phosphodiesterase